ncbi:MAG: sulfatase, partial [Kiritimatiellales bacterium]|nr:sulfatase [Kiritimatiellales bacterium]
MHYRKKITMAVVMAAGMLLPLAGYSSNEPRPMNVLFVMVDDLKPLMGCYGDPIAKTPNMDRLAARGVLFERATCQISLCAPSRASIFTGLRPDTLKCYTNVDKFRKNLPGIVTMPQAFQRSGYHTVSIGKVYDARNCDPGAWDEEMLPSSETEKKIYALEENERLYHENDARFKAATTQEKFRLWRVGPAYENAPLDESHYWDDQVAEQAIATLRRIKDKPFFLGVGFIKPHLPFACPKKYWDLYDHDSMPLASNPEPPDNGVPMALHDGFELRQYQGIPRKGRLDDDLARTLIQGYYACASFVDAMIGRVLDELDALGLKDNTIIVLMGDHGWHLGDKGIWGKLTAYQEATIAPMIVVDPRRNGGSRVNGLVEFVDICPTLCELAGVAAPDGFEGTSFAPLLADPSKNWKRATFSEVGRGAAWKEFIGTSMRTERYNYVEWRHRTKGTLQARELYDLETDPREMNNLALTPE